MSGALGIPVPYQGQPISFSSSFGTRPNPAQNGQGPSGIPLTFSFSPSGNTAYSVSLQSTFPSGVSNIQTIYIDNSQSATPTTIIFPLSSETIVAEPYTRGWYPAATNALTFNIYNNANAATSVTAVVYNFIIPPLVINGTGLNLASNGLIVPNLVGSLVEAGNLVPGTTPIQVGGFFGNPFYYLSGINLTYVSEKAPTFQATQVLLYDSVNLGVSITKLFGSWNICQSNNQDIQATLTDINGLYLAGTTQLYIRTTAAFSTFASIGFSITGGYTAANFV